MNVSNENTPYGIPNSSLQSDDERGQKSEVSPNPVSSQGTEATTSNVYTPAASTTPPPSFPAFSRDVRPLPPQPPLYAPVQTSQPVPAYAHVQHTASVQTVPPTQSTPTVQHVSPDRPVIPAQHTVPVRTVPSGQVAPPVQHTAPTQAVPPTQPYYQQSYQVPQKTPAKSAPKKSKTEVKSFLFGFLGAALAVVIGFFGLAIYNVSSNEPSTGTAVTVLGSSNPSEIEASDTDAGLAEAVSKKALPSVVNIDVYTEQSSSGFFGSGGSSDGSLVESSLGSGVILSEDGYIITNYHVVADADALEVTIGGETYQAEIVGSDPSSDIAVIKAEGASGLTPIEIGSSSDLSVGEWVMTIGSPFGLEQSVATGIVSATSRSQIMDSTTGGSMTVYTNLIQTDAAINPGNSGGALVDADGKLIGINTLISSYSGNYSGVGFAIPVDYAISLAQQIIEGKTPTHAQLGVSLLTVDSSIAQRYGLSADAGAYVSEVYSGSGAASAGIKEGDIIIKFDDRKITSASDLMLEIRSKNPGDTISLELNRSGQVTTIEVTLGSDSEVQELSRQGSYQESTNAA